jgi:putative membrane protein
MASLKNVLVALHVVAVISWMAGILYLYRLVIYHVEETEAVVRARFRVMEMRLYRYITRPAMWAATLFGACVIATDPRYYLRAHWLHAKLTLVALLVGATLYAARSVRRLAEDAPMRSSRHYRVMNEVPTLLMIGIVFLVILKPF